MLLRNQAPKIDSRPAITAQGFEHLSHTAIAVLRWLNANRVDYVLVGPVARAIRGDSHAAGPVAIVPAPYGRNFERLARAVSSAHARVRPDGGPGRAEGFAADTPPVRLTAEKLASAQRWTLRSGEHEFDIEGHPDGGSGGTSYQELLYEATRFRVAPEVSVEVAAPEDIEHYDHLRRTGTAPEIRVSRGVREPELP